MKRLKQAGAALAAMVAIVLAGLLVTNPRIVLQIPEARAQHAIDVRLPLSRDARSVKYRVTAATVTFLDSGRARVVAEIELKALGTTATARVTASAEPYYRDEAFFLRDFQAEATEILSSSLPPAEMDRLAALAAKIPAATKDKINSLVEHGVETVLQEHPVYRLQPTDFRHTIARLVLSDIRVEAGQLDATLDPLGGGLRGLVWLALAVSAAVAAALGWSSRKAYARGA